MWINLWSASCLHHLRNRGHTGQPVAWCITNYETTEVLELFLGKLKERTPGSRISVLMSDDGNYINTLKSVRLFIVAKYTCAMYFLQMMCTTQMPRKFLGKKSGTFFAGGMLKGMRTPCT